MFSWLLRFCILAPFFFAASLQGGPPLRIITVGDSITRGAGVKPEENFAARIQKTLIEKGYPCELTNAGIGGDTADALRRLQTGVIAKKPDLVTVMYGTNDSYVPKGETQSRNSLEKYEEGLRKMIASLKQAKIQPVIMTSPRWAEGAPPNGVGEDPNVRLARYAEVCRKVAKDMEVPLVDHFAYWTEASKQGVTLKSWTSDFCHPNPVGHQQMADEILKVVLPLVDAITTNPKRPAG
jgi:acyl-CoA thioesterase-1